MQRRWQQEHSRQCTVHHRLVLGGTGKHDAAVQAARANTSRASTIGCVHVRDEEIGL